MSVKKILLGILLIIFGIFGVMFGQADDSPGAGGIGLIFIGIGVYFMFKAWTKKKVKAKK